MRVFDKELGLLYDNVEHGSLADRVLSYGLINDGVAHELPEDIKANQDRFVFLTDIQVNDIVVKALSARNPIVDNVEFQQKYEFDKELLTAKKLDFRMDLLKEEFGETLSAYENKDAEELVDGLIDLVVIALGTLYLSKVSVNEAWTEVFRANMSKVRGVKPGREQSGGFDVIKPEGWKGPDHSANHGVLDELFTTPSTEE